MIVNPENSFKYLKNLQLNKGQEYKEAVQVKPQHVQLKLRTSKYYSFRLRSSASSLYIYNLLPVSYPKIQQIKILILIFLLTWAGLAALHKSDTI